MFVLKGSGYVASVNNERVRHLSLSKSELRQLKYPVLKMDSSPSFCLEAVGNFEIFLKNDDFSVVSGINILK